MDIHALTCYGFLFCVERVLAFVVKSFPFLYFGEENCSPRWFISKS